MSRNYCINCKPGYAQKSKISPSHALGNIESTCVEGTIKNCVFEFIQQSNQRICIGCLGGLYLSISQPGNRYSRKKIAKPVPNCMWGSTPPLKASSRHQEGSPASLGGPSQARCLRCNDGYAVNQSTGQCEKASQVGCWFNENPTTCATCNPFLGYSMDANRKCFKGASGSVDVVEAVRKLNTRLSRI